MRHSNQFKQAILPSRHPHFHVNPRIGACAEKLRGHSVSFAPAFLPRRATQPPSPRRTRRCTRKIRLLPAFGQARAPPRTPRRSLAAANSKHRDDSLFLHCINARVYRRDGRLVDYDQIPQSLPGTIHPAHPTLHGSFRLIVAQKRKNQPPATGGLRKPRTRPHMLHRTGLRVNAPRARRVLHQCFQRPVDPATGSDA